MLANQVLRQRALKPFSVTLRSSGKKLPRKFGCGQLLCSVNSLLRPSGTNDRLLVPASVRVKSASNPDFCSEANVSGAWIPCGNTFT
ncbi:hypothetical protein D3C87_1741370 [compost metagenome]